MSGQYRNEEVIDDVVRCIKKIRMSKNITLETFYFDTGIHLARIEQGKTNITVSTLSRFCDYFGLTLAEFFILAEKYKGEKPG